MTKPKRITSQDLLTMIDEYGRAKRQEGVAEFDIDVPDPDTDAMYERIEETLSDFVDGLIERANSAGRAETRNAMVNFLAAQD